MFYFLLAIELIIGIAIVVLVLIQPHEGEGMGAVFGGSSSVETFLGTKTISVLWKATVVLGILFIGLAILLNIISKQSSASGSVPDDPAVEQPAEKKSAPKKSAPSNNNSSGGEDGSSSNQQ